jgi:hypothetical protein
LISSNATLNFVYPFLSAFFSGSVTVQSGGAIVSDGAALFSSQGTGGSFTTANYGLTGGGGGHGGYGGGAAGGPAGGNSYDSLTFPTLSGSSGGSGAGISDSGGKGGGLINMNMASLVLNGRISADGVSGVALGSGGGSGGTVILTVGSFSGSGSISANGGSGVGYGGGGGGGRIGINYTTSTFTGTTAAAGGSGYVAGGAGTIYTKASAAPIGRLLVDNAGNFGTNTPISAGNNFDLTIRNGAIVNPSSGYLVVSNLVIGPNGTLKTLNTQTNVDLAVLGNATVDVDGLISVDGKGFGRGSGPGAGVSLGFIGSGAGYGGFGGASSIAPGGLVYGSASQPIDPGSGGGSGFGSSSSGSQGGGVVRLSVGRTLSMAGRVSADGTAGLQDDAGGGSGGSIWVTARTVLMNGVVSANGGAGELYQGGGGGGGRIAIHSLSNNITGLLAVAGGDGYNSGQPGTIHLATNLDTFGVIAQTPSGMVSNGVDYVDLIFSTPIATGSLSTSNVAISTATGPVESPLSLTMLGTSRLRVGFGLQTLPGNYIVTVGTQFTDIYGQPMSQVYTGAFTISLPVITGTVTDSNGLPLPGVILSLNIGPSTVTDTNGKYIFGAIPNTALTVTPWLNDLTFLPAFREYADVSSSISNQNYTAVSTIAPMLITSFEPPNLALRWWGLPGVSYQALYSTNLINWLPYGSLITGTNGGMQILVPVSSDPAKFFRIQAGN